MISPGAPLVWLHCGSSSSAGAVLSLAQHLADQEGLYRVLVTAPTRDRLERRIAPHPAITFAPPPSDTPAGARGFLEDAKPATALWFGGALKPAVSAAIENAALPAILVNLGMADLAPRGLSWRARNMRAALAPFARIYVTDGATSARLQRIGMDRSVLEVTGPVMEDPKAPHHDPNELTVMAEAISGRPCWFAAAAVPGELAQLVQAHRAAARRGHRLLMLISPRDTADGLDFGDRLNELGLRAGVRSRDEDPQEDHQAYVVDMPGEAGLWYRIAPLTFMGGTLSGPDGLSPFEPASVGSAVLNGPFTKPWGEQYDRLTAAGASRKIRTSAELGIALGELMAPDRSASMANAGWEEVTRSATMLNNLLDLVEMATMEGVIA